MILNCSKEHPLIVILPNSETVIFDSGAVNVTSQVYSYDSGSSYNDPSPYIFTPMIATLNVHAQTNDNMLILTKGGAKAYLRYKEKERRSNLKKKGGRNHASR